MFCVNCGTQLMDNTNVCPYCGTPVRQPEPVQPAYQQPVNPYPVNPRPVNTEPIRTPLGGLALGFGIAALILSFIGLASSAAYRNAFSVVLTFLALMLSVGTIIFGAVGLRRSIRTNGRRKYVPGIVMSAIGLALGSLALIYSLIGLLFGRYM